ncbi:MAG TPA: OmpA family protein [Mucilaginibacter sp.]|nr:OmpA family protein [Mucilaginibacter sp.]
MKILYAIFCTFFISTGVFAQYHTFKSKADKAFENKNYYEAAYYYRKAVEDKKSSQAKIPFYSSAGTQKKPGHGEYLYNCYHLAESYRLYENYSQAIEWYNKVLSEDNGYNYPYARLWYGICLRAGQQFHEALKQLKQFVILYKHNDAFAELGNREIANCYFAEKQYSGHPATEISKMASPWNAGGGDYALVRNKNNYWFTSTRFVANDKKHLNKIYTAPVQGAAEPTVFELNFADQEKNGEYGTISLDSSGKRMYLTRWYRQAAKTMMAIYHTELVNNTWSAPQKLNNIINAEGFNALQPFVTADGKRLFFVSDKPGGQGGDDIWVSNLDDTGNPVDAVNLGKIVNTPFDEQSPLYDNEHQRLVFSSKGFTGLGGFDLFESLSNNGQWSSPANLGYPVNSSKDDLYFYPDPGNKSKFYISSDRESECCLNLFRGEFKQSFITGILIDCDAGKPLPGVKVSLVDSMSKQTLQQLTTGQNAVYNFEATANHAYKVVFEKSGYLTKVVPALARPRTDTLINPDICLQEFKINKPIVIKNILYDFNKADLRPESKIALDGVVAAMNDNPLIKIELGSHTDSIGSDTYNLKLSQKRAQSCVDYIISKGIAKSRIIAKGYGESIPKAPNSLPDGHDDPAGRQLNRRTEFTVKQ